MNEAACRWEPHRLAAVVADAAVAVLAVVPPDEVVLQQVAPEQLLDLPPGSIQMPFLPCPALPVVKPAGAAAEQALAVAAGAVRPHLRDRNLQQVACSF